MAKILVVDDDKMFCEPFSYYIEEIGYECRIASTFQEGLHKAEKGDFDIVFLDVYLPDTNGLEGINRLKQVASSPEVVVITGQGSTYGAEIALKNGAWDYLPKPPSYSNIKLTVNRALQYRARMKQFHGQKLLNRDAIIGQDPRLMDCLEIVARSSETDDGVLVTGETGTGKQLIAQAIHNNSPRSKSGFVTVDCPNLPENLIESLLFGHIKGSFTGAQDNQQGMIQQAHEGTLFLDEVGDLHPSGQKSLLSVLQSKKFRPLGAKEEKRADFRVISATNKPVAEMVEKGHFRKDLYFRLFGFHIDLPPLRERTEDIKLLVNHYLNLICEESGLSIKGVSNDYLDFLIDYEWPGNIRELINVMRTSIANARQEPVIYPHHLPLNLRVSLTQKRFADGPPDEAQTPAVTLGINHLNFPDIKLFRQLTESIYLEDLVKIAEGNIQSACEMSGVSRSGLYLLLEKHGKKLKKKG